MEKTVSAQIPITTAARLFVSNEISFDTEMPLEQYTEIIKAIGGLEASVLLQIADHASNCHIESDGIPQFGSIEALISVPKILMKQGGCPLNYAQLGFKLKNDLNAKLEANIKFGENHGKGATQIGLVQCMNGMFSLTPIGKAFCCIDDSEIQTEIVCKLFFRIPVVQQILRFSKDIPYNGFLSMQSLGDSTKKRRSQCLRRIFATMRTLGNPEINARIENIIWEIE